MNIDFIIYKLLFAVIILMLSLVVAMYATLAERKVAGFFQDRLGPNRAGIFGLLQPVADGVKLFFKEEFMPAKADKVLYILGPCLTMLVALLSSAVIPWGDTLIIGGKEFALQMADVNIGVLYTFAVVSIGVYGVMIGGYHTEYSSMKLGFYLFSEYINMFIASAMISTLYFGGYNFPFMNELGLSHNWISIIGTLVLLAKIFFFVFVFMWVRWTLPRFRYDQLMRFGWKGLMPWAFINMIVTGFFYLLIKRGF